MITFLAFAVLGLKHVRGVIWFGVVLAPTVALHLDALRRHPGSGDEVSAAMRRHRGLNVLLAGALLVLAFLSLPWFKSFWPVTSEKAGLISGTPAQALPFMRANNLPAPVFNDLGFGSYLMWAGQPEHNVFVDPRVEVPAGDPGRLWDSNFGRSGLAGNCCAPWVPHPDAGPEYAGSAHSSGWGVAALATGIRRPRCSYLHALRCPLRRWG